MTETICGTFPAHAGNNNGTFTVRDSSITVNYASAPDIYEINVHYVDGTSQSFGTNFGSAPTPGSIEWMVTLKSPAKWVQVHSFNDHYGEPSCPVVTQPEPPALNDPVFQWVTGDPEIDCEGMTVTVVSHEEAAGWYWGNDGEQHLGGFHPTETEPETTVRPATAEECPAPPLDEEEETPDTENEEGTPDAEEEDTPETPEEGFEWGEDVQVDCEQGTITFSFWQQREGFEKEEFSDTYPASGEELAEAGCEVEKPVQTAETVATVSQKSEPEQLAVTGAGLEWTALIIGSVFVMAGLALYLKRSGR